MRAAAAVGLTGVRAHDRSRCWEELAMLERALLEDGRGEVLLQGKLNDTRDWRVVNEFCRQTYMPPTTRPLTRGAIRTRRSGG